MHQKGYGFLRNPAKNYIAQPADAFVDQRLIQKSIVVHILLCRYKSPVCHQHCSEFWIDFMINQQVCFDTYILIAKHIEK